MKRPRGRSSTWMARALVVLVFNACSMSPPPTAMMVRTAPARDYLVGTQEQRAGYGLYSYLLFANPPTAETRARYLAAIEAVLELTTVTDFGEYVPMRQINVTYVPVTARPPGSATADTILRTYNYARARAVLLSTHGSYTSGPYIVSSLAPLQAGAPPTTAYLWQDLSSVPPSLVRLWVREYLAEAVNEEGFTGDEARADWTIRLRTAVTVVAEGIPDVKNALDALIKWFNEPDSGSSPRRHP